MIIGNGTYASISSIIATLESSIKKCKISNSITIILTSSLNDSKSGNIVCNKA